LIQGENMNKKITWLVTGLLLASLLVGCAPAAEPAPQVIKETVVVKETVPAVQETVLVPAPTLAAPPPAEAAPVTLTVADPTGALEVTTLHAPRVDDLNGKTICEISTNLTWEAYRTFPVIRGLLQKLYPTAKIIPFTEFPNGSENIDTPETADAVVAAGCQAAIVGNGG
jgi:hypothetical protein